MIALLRDDKRRGSCPTLWDELLPVEPTSSLIPATRVKPGDIWQLGEHRLMCGDATSAKDVMRLMQSERAILMVTDPPYGVKYRPEWRNELLGKEGSVLALNPVTNDHNADWSRAYALACVDIAYVYHASLLTRAVADGLEACNFELRNLIVWSKNIHSLSRGDYHWKHELCWYAVRKGAKRKWNGGRNKTTVWEVPPLHSYSNKEHHTGHGTQKPVRLFEIPIENHTDPHDLIYDPFIGSGTCLIAAENLHRRCYGMEIEPTYCDMTLSRWEQLTSQQAEKVEA